MDVGYSRISLSWNTNDGDDSSNTMQVGEPERRKERETDEK
jgi:hypothetical protein